MWLQPNIHILWGDDTGWRNISAYNHGVMGYKTPNIDRGSADVGLITCIHCAVTKVDSGYEPQTYQFDQDSVP
jgi:hypothetical protein